MSGLPIAWFSVALGDIAAQRNAKTDPSDLPDLPFVGLEEVEAHSGRITSTQSTRGLKSAVSLFQKGDLLYARLRPYLNKVTLPDFSGAASAEFIVLQQSPVLEQRYLQSVLMSPDFVSFTALNSTGDRPRVSFESICSYKFALPPLPEQRRIVAKIDSLSAKSGRARDQLDHLPRLVESTSRPCYGRHFRAT